MKNMNCSTFKKQMETAIENRTKVKTPEFEKHRKSCASCASFYRSSQMLNYAIDQWKKESFQIDFVDRVLYHLEQENSDFTQTDQVVIPPTHPQKSGASERVRHPGRLVTALALLLVMVSTFALIQFTNQPTDNSLLTQQNGRNQMMASGDSSMEVDTMIKEVGSAYLALANDTANSVSNAVTIVSPGEKKKNVETGNKRSSQYQWIRTLGNDLKPIQKDLGDAMDFLYQSLPEDSPSTI